LHVLSTPPAFVLSQNQTLRRKFHLSWQPAIPATSDKNSDQKSILASLPADARSRASFVGH
jgi:hypothetical protein